MTTSEINLFCGLDEFSERSFYVETELDEIKRNDFVDGKAVFVFYQV